MFIEKISKEKKEKYIQNYIDEINLENYPFTPLSKMHLEDEAYKKFEPSERDKQDAKEWGYDKLFEKLEKENIYIRFYETSGADMLHRYYYQHAFIFIFGDTDLKILKEYVGCRDFYYQCCATIKEYVKKNSDKLKIDDKLNVNKDYVTTFMAENVENIEEYIDYIKNHYKNAKSEYIKEIEKEEQNILNKMMEYTLD